MVWRTVSKRFRKIRLWRTHLETKKKFLVKDCKSGLRAYSSMSHDERFDFGEANYIMGVVMMSVSIRTPIRTCLVDDGQALLKFSIRPIRHKQLMRRLTSLTNCLRWRHTSQVVQIAGAKMSRLLGQKHIDSCRLNTRQSSIRLTHSQHSVKIEVVLRRIA